MEEYFGCNLNFKEFVLNIEAVKSLFWETIASFSCVELQKEVEFKLYFRKLVYSLKFEEWRCDRILEYIYNDIDSEKWNNIINK